jgi:hypothetical protein
MHNSDALENSIENNLLFIWLRLENRIKKAKGFNLNRLERSQEKHRGSQFPNK